MLKRVRSYYVEKLPANPKSQLPEVSGGHLETPQVALEQVMAWVPQALAA